MTLTPGLPALAASTTWSHVPQPLRTAVESGAGPVLGAVEAAAAGPPGCARRLTSPEAGCLAPAVRPLAPKLVHQGIAGGWRWLLFEHVSGRATDLSPGSADRDAGRALRRWQPCGPRRRHTADREPLVASDLPPACPRPLRPIPRPIMGPGHRRLAPRHLRRGPRRLRRLRPRMRPRRHHLAGYEVICDVRSLCTTLFACATPAPARQVARKRITAWRASAVPPAPQRSRGRPASGNGPQPVVPEAARALTNRPGCPSVDVSAGAASVEPESARTCAEGR